MSRSKTDTVGTADSNDIEAPVSIRAYLICAFASFGGILFGYDSGYISGVLGMVWWIVACLMLLTYAMTR
jgi:MFS transporter, SP family, sugar:H+ symporter